jgi:glucose/arabinose dehydrogenase
VSEPIAVLEQPIALLHRNHDLYVLEREGRVIRLADEDAPSLILDVSERVVPEGEEGLLGGAFSPDGRFLYLYKVTEGWSLLVEYTMRADGDAIGSSRREVLRFQQPFLNHNGGQVLFGPDCYLYLFTGDGEFSFTGSDPNRAALDLSSPLGKILRLDPRPHGDRPYGIPPDNPYLDVDGSSPLVWAQGLRNPWRASFDPLTGDLWIGDVGENDWEEINVASHADGYGRGVSFGWSAFEGLDRRNTDQPAEGHQDPWHVYDRSRGCSVAAGERYRGEAIPELVGWFVSADFCKGAVRAIQVTPEGPGREVFLGHVPMPVEVRRGPDLELYVVSLGGGIYPLLPA